MEKKREAKKARKEEEKAEMVKAIREQVMKELCEKFCMEPQPSRPSLDVTPDTEERSLGMSCHLRFPALTSPLTRTRAILVIT